MAFSPIIFHLKAGGKFDVIFRNREESQEFHLSVEVARDLIL